ncbi:hypothetical protein ACTQ5A_11875, partial [Bacillota bacterium LCP21S3_F9]
VISGGDNPYDIHDAKLSSSATAHESSSVTAHEISNRNIIRRNFIVLKDEDGDVVLWTDFHRMRRVGERLWYAASTVMMKNDSGALSNSLITCFLIVIISPV